MNTGYNIIDDSDFTSKIEDTPLIICSAGCYRLVKQQHLKTYRCNGRKDFQLLYITQGKGYFKRDGNFFELKEGELIIYYPDEVQEYDYFLKDKPEVYWLHFAGTLASQLLAPFTLDSLHKVKIGLHGSYLNLWNKIIGEIQIKEEHYEQLTNLYLQELLLKMLRGNILIDHNMLNKKALFRNIMEDFHNQYNQNTKISEYALKNHISTCWLIRGFKEETGFTPQIYITKIRMNKAKELLLYSELSINEIASIIGYENPLYFSRIFKKNMNLSPNNYRKKYLYVK